MIPGTLTLTAARNWSQLAPAPDEGVDEGVREAVVAK